MKMYILQEKVPSRSDFKWTFSRNCEGTEQLRMMVIIQESTSRLPGSTCDKVYDDVLRLPGSMEGLIFVPGSACGAGMRVWKDGKEPVTKHGTAVYFPERTDFSGFSEKKEFYGKL
ncbi:MAG: hypothetical protein LUG56_08835 [Lachnospiraceae bacterium]|nr:hypothetical protein [Lachnospiraceae bacterium]